MPIARFRSHNSNRSGAKETPQLLLCLIAITTGGFGLLILTAVSIQNIAWATNVTPVRLLLVLVITFINIGSQVSRTCNQ